MKFWNFSISGFALDHKIEIAGENTRVKSGQQIITLYALYSMQYALINLCILCYISRGETNYKMS